MTLSLRWFWTRCALGRAVWSAPFLLNRDLEWAQREGGQSDVRHPHGSRRLLGGSRTPRCAHRRQSYRVVWRRRWTLTAHGRSKGFHRGPRRRCPTTRWRGQLFPHALGPRCTCVIPPAHTCPVLRASKSVRRSKKVFLPQRRRVHRGTFNRTQHFVRGRFQRCI